MTDIIVKMHIVKKDFSKPEIYLNSILKFHYMELCYRKRKEKCMRPGIFLMPLKTCCTNKNKIFIFKNQLCIFSIFVFNN